MLVDQWKTLGSELPESWSSAELELRLEQRGEGELASRLLGPAQPFRPEPGVLRFRVARDGTAPSPDGIQRLLRRIDSERVHGKLALVGSSSRDVPAELIETSLVAAWDAAEQSLPADWSHLLCEVELRSTDYIDRASLNCVPMNLRRIGDSPRLRFRAARVQGYGASPGMVRRCFERCDSDGIKGTMRVLNVVSSADQVGTQGPVWISDAAHV
ncbi:MAG TPA: hypothetical protein VGU02_02660 [Gaiellaceae bacterium]|nr:hypothetical protein [Gaiellaceae bacterium]